MDGVFGQCALCALCGRGVRSRLSFGVVFMPSMLETWTGAAEIGLVLCRRNWFGAVSVHGDETCRVVECPGPDQMEREKET